jgi:hypothetical protein
VSGDLAGSNRRGQVGLYESQSPNCSEGIVLRVMSDVALRHTVALSDLNIHHSLELSLCCGNFQGNPYRRGCHCCWLDRDSGRLRILLSQNQEPLKGAGIVGQDIQFNRNWRPRDKSFSPHQTRHINHNEALPSKFFVDQRHYGAIITGKSQFRL